MSRRSSAAEQREPPRRIGPRVRAEEVLDNLIAEGRAIIADVDRVRDEESYREWKDRMRRWRDVGERALENLFTTREMADRFLSACAPKSVLMAGVIDPHQQAGDVGDGVNKLISYRDQLDYIEPADPETESPPPREALESGRLEDAQVFLVHGRDDDLKTRVARTMERTGDHRVVILHEQANKGRTIIEKFEDYASASDYAVVLATADDLGRLDPKHLGPDEEPHAEIARARQNVIFELGYFVGALGRSRVALLYEPGVELPTDYSGVTYIELDVGGRWQFTLLSELRSAGLSFDLNRLT